MPLSTAFTDGEAAWQEVKELANHIHRVRKVHDSRKALESGKLAIEEHAEFMTKHGTQFTDLSELVSRLRAIEHYLDEKASMRELIVNFDEAGAQRTYTDKENWTRLQSLKAQASLELDEQLIAWRQEACRRLDEALARIPGELEQNRLDPARAENLGSPLAELREGLNSVTLPAQVAALLDRADGAISGLCERITQEAAAGAPSSGVTGGGKPAEAKSRKVKRLRVNEVALRTRVSTEEEWDGLKGKLDKRVRKLLGEGFDVEVV